MRKFLTTLFAASAIALPATAATIPDGPQQRGHTRADSEGPRGDRADRGDRGTRGSDDGAQRAQRSRPNRPQMTAPQAETSSRPSQWTRQPAAGNPQAPAEARTYQRRERDAATEVQRESGVRRDSQWTRDRTGTVRREAEQIRRDRPSGSFGTRVGTATQHPQWTRDWRNDRRYDWRDYRTRNRTVFRVGVYYDPYGYNYRRWNVGWSMRPSYYQSNFWINDPWQYRLPDVYGPYRWVRYYDDAILVNTFSGEVVDVIYNFFW